MSIVNSEAGDHLLAEASKSNNMFPYVEHQISRITRGTEKLAQGESLMPSTRQLKMQYASALALEM